MRLVAGLVLAVLLAVPTLAGCGSDRSVKAYCQTFIEEGQKFRASYAGTNTQDPLSALIQLLGAPQELATMFKKLQKVSPDEIEEDVEVLQKSFQKIADDAAANAGHPMQAALEALMLGASTKGATDRVNDYTAKNCGPLPGAGQSASSSATAAFDPSSSSDTASPTPTPTPTSDPAEPGAVVLDPDRVNEACDAVDVDMGAGTVEFELWIRSGGIAVFTCLGRTLVVYDLVNQVKLWETPLTESTVGVAASDEHVYLVDATKHKATGLKEAYTSTELASYNLRTGDPAWEVPLNDWVDNDSRPTDKTLYVVEDPTEVKDPVVTVTYEKTTSFSAATGKERWHRDNWTNEDDAAEQAVDDGGLAVTPDITITSEERDNDDGSISELLVGRSTRTAKELWTLSPPKSVNPNDYGEVCGSWHELERSRLWCGHGGWSETINVVTGNRISSLVLPHCDDGSCHFSPYGALVVGADKLSYYTDADKPDWKVDATASVSVAGMGPKHLLLEAESGPVMLDVEDGSEVPGADNPGEFGSDSSQVSTFAKLIPQYGDLKVFMIDLPS